MAMSDGDMKAVVLRLNVIIALQLEALIAVQQEPYSDANSEACWIRAQPVGDRNNCG